MNELDRLMEAIELADAPAVRELLSANHELLETTDKYGCTPLMRAVMCDSRQPAVIRELLDAGANVNRQTDEGYSALHCAIDVNFEANLNSREVIALLVAAGADLKLKEHYGWTPLLRAVVEGTLDEVQALLEAGADPNEILPHDTLPAFNAGCTTLMAALTNCDSEAVVESLLRAGADPMARDANGATIFERAAEILKESPEGEFAESIRRCLEIVRNYPAGARSNQS